MENAEVLRELCSKLGVTMEFLVAEYSKYILIKSSVFLILEIIVIVASILFLKKAIILKKKYNEEEMHDLSDDSYFRIMVTIIFSSIALIVFSVFVIGDIIKIIGCCKYPTAVVIDKIINTPK